MKTAATVIIWLCIIAQTLGFGGLAIFAELNGAHWLAITFIILCFLTLFLPKSDKTNEKLKDRQ